MLRSSGFDRIKALISIVQGYINRAPLLQLQGCLLAEKKGKNREKGESREKKLLMI